MSEQSKPDQKTLDDLALAKALFQQRSILAHLGEIPPGSKNRQETQGDGQP